MVVDILKGKTTAAEVARRHNLTVSEVEGWIKEGLAEMENVLRARPWDLRDEYERKLAEEYQALGEAQLQIKVLRKPSSCSARPMAWVRSVALAGTRTVQSWNAFHYRPGRPDRACRRGSRGRVVPAAVLKRYGACDGESLRG